MKWIIIASVLVLSGCWNKEFQEPGRLEVEAQPTEVIMGANFSRVWSATQTVVGKFPIQQRDADAQTGRAYLITDWVRSKSDVLYDGYDVNRIPKTIRYKLALYLVSDGVRTKVTVKNTEEYLDDVVTAGVDMQGNLETWIKTDSSTLKENNILREIKKLVDNPDFKGDTGMVSGSTGE